MDSLKSYVVAVQGADGWKYFADCKIFQLGMVVYAYKPSYVGGVGRRITVLGTEYGCE
jgi:hypothetical protein